MHTFRYLMPLDTMERISRQKLCEDFDNVLERVDKEDIGFVIVDDEGKEGHVLCPARWMEYCFDDDFGCIINSALRYAISRHTVTYNANGGTGAPGAQVKTHGENLTLSSVKPSKSNCVFLGWNTQSTATVSQYSAGSTYTDNKSITLYAVWEKAKYDFSISNLTIGESSIYRYGTTTVRVRVDSWDKVNAYSGIPVELLYDGTVVGTQNINLSAYGIAYVTFNLNVGNTVGSHSVSARVNWNNHTSEDNTANNSVSGSLNVLDYDYEMSVGSVALNSSYCEGTTVISSFTVNNDSDVDILPSHHNSASFSAYYYNGSTKVVIWTDKKTDVVIPSGGSNLVYFKWTVPSGLTGKTVYCECTVNSDNSLNEENRNNNTVVFQTVIKSVLESQTPDTRYESTAPASYSPSAPIPTNNRTGLSWTEWKYENGGNGNDERKTLGRPSHPPTERGLHRVHALRIQHLRHTVRTGSPGIVGRQLLSLQLFGQNRFERILHREGQVRHERDSRL